MYEILKVSQEDNYLSVSVMEHNQNTEEVDGIALCGARYLRHEFVSITADNRITANSLYSYSGKVFSSTTYCSVCNIITGGRDYLAQLRARVMRDGQAHSDWTIHTLDLDAPTDISYCRYSESVWDVLHVSQDVDFATREEISKPTCTTKKDCEECDDLAEARRREKLLADPHWVQEKMEDLRHRQTRHREYGDGEQTMTVGDLMDELAKFDRSLPVVYGSHYLANCCDLRTEYNSHLGLEQEDGWVELPDTGGEFIKDVHPGGVDKTVVMLR